MSEWWRLLISVSVVVGAAALLVRQPRISPEPTNLEGVIVSVSTPPFTQASDTQLVLVQQPGQPRPVQVLVYPQTTGCEQIDRLTAGKRNKVWGREWLTKEPPYLNATRIEVADPRP